MSDLVIGRLLTKVATAAKEVGIDNFEQQLDKMITGGGALTKKNIGFEELVIRIIARELGLPIEKIKVGTGKASVGLSICYSYLKHNCKFTATEIAKGFGRSSHSSVVRRINELPKNKDDYSEYKRIEKILDQEILKAKNKKK